LNGIPPVVNTRKQKLQHEPEPIDDLAKAATLNQDAEKEKEVMMIEVGGGQTIFIRL
jgi:hypothetical protein